LCYQSTGTETRFTCGLDPEPRSRRVFSFHRPETLAAWIVPAGSLPPPGRGTARRAPTKTHPSRDGRA
jgi:type I restriction enzyme R subunit